MAKLKLSPAQIRAIKNSPKGKVPSFISGETRDNRITNKLVRQGKLPKSQLEVYPQKKRK